ncbi:hypothetical protein [Paenibacillus humicus]|uniref:hypothetical protein n=1 Tax=Paenibacillus humicus TaxID=412861 RepID=UPI003F1806E1
MMCRTRLLALLAAGLIAGAWIAAPASALTIAGSNGSSHSVPSASERPDKVMLLYGNDVPRDRLMAQYRMLKSIHDSVALQLAGTEMPGERAGLAKAYVIGEQAETAASAWRRRFAEEGIGLETLDEPREPGVPKPGIRDTTTGLSYFMLKDVNPFLDLNELERKGEWLQERNISFFVELRPVFVNAESEGIKAYFAEVRSLLERGGIPLLAPLKGWSPPDEWQSYVEGSMVAGVTDSLEPERLMKQAWDAYAQQGIYIAGMSGPLDLLFDPSWKPILRRTGLFVEDGAWQGYSRDIGPEEAWDGIYLPYREGLEPAASEGELPAAASRVIGLEAGADPAAMSSMLEEAASGGTVFAEASLVDGRIQWDRDVQRTGGRLLIDGNLPAEHVPPGGEPADPAQPEAETSLTLVNKSIQSAMVVLLVVSILVAAAFATFFVVGRQINRRKFLR